MILDDGITLLWSRYGGSTTQTGPRANVIGWPDTVVNAVPP